MPDMLIKDGALVLGRRVLCNGSVLVRGTGIRTVGRSIPAGRATTIDAAGCYVSAGFIDGHIHGDAPSILANEIPKGTTAVVITMSCAPLSKIFSEAARLRKFIGRDPLGPSVLGMRLEGPYINRTKAGAQDPRSIRHPDAGELLRIIARCRPLLKMMTIAPELEGAIPLIRLLRRRGVIASIGHTYADFDEARRGMRAGITHATHVFNAMRLGDAADQGSTGAVLSDRRVAAEMILDLVHVPKERFKALIREKGPGRTMLVTDSVRACPGPGVKMKRGAYTFADGRLAGSSISMIDAVRNAVKECGVSLCDAVRMATLNPARIFGVDDRKGSLASGKDADIVIFDGSFNVKMVIVRGRIAYRCA
jgi:N-acetylglucosamine-6-phosphate deacetylase